MESPEKTPSSQPVLIDMGGLSEDALFGIIESFIQRDGTDYGVHEVSYSTKFEQVLKKIKSQEFLITFEPESESVTILTKDQWKALTKGLSYDV